MEYKYRMKLKRMRLEINELKEKNKTMESQIATVMNYINQQDSNNRQSAAKDCG